MKKLYGMILGLVLIVIDQITKYLVTSNFSLGEEKELIKGIFSLEYIRNTGAAWGMMQNKTMFFALFSAIVCIFLVIFYIKIPKEKKYNILSIVTIFLISGAIGNMIDRIFRKYVVDFLYFKMIDFPVFNIADIYVTCSGIVLVLVVLFVYKDEDFEFVSMKKIKNKTDNTKENVIKAENKQDKKIDNKNDK